MRKKAEATVVSPASSKQNGKDLQAALAELRSKYGEDSIGAGSAPRIEWIKTGLYPFDFLAGGGLPRGRFTQIYGPKSSGKTTLCHHIEAMVQKEGGIAVHIDAEHAMDPDYATTLGVSVDDLIFSRPDSIEESETIIQKLAGKVDLIVIDSITAVAGEKEIRGIEKDGMEKDSMMVIPQNLSKFFRIVNPIIGKSRTAVILVNQTRTNIGGYVAFDDFAGGNALKHYNSLSFMVRPGPKDDNPKAEDGKTAIGQCSVIKVDKNKVGGQPVGSLASFNIYYDSPHIRPLEEMVAGALAKGIVSREGNTYSFDGKKIATNRDAALKAINESKDLQEGIVKAMEASIVA